MDNNVILDGLGALIVLVILIAGREYPRSGSPQTRDMRASMIRVLMICCVTVFLLDIPGLLLDGSNFYGARTLLWLFDSAYWTAHILYFWLWVVFADMWIFSSEEAAKRRSRAYALPMLV